MANHRIKQDADLEFRRGIEELVRGHLDDCMTNFSSCSSAVAGEDEDESSPSATERRRRRSALDGDDLAESSAAARRHSRILSRWVARQAEEMITTMERRNRESELMALAGLHTVSMLDPSFLREPRRSRSRSPSNVERPTEPRASRILQMWRELEDMSRERRSAVNSVGGDRIRTDDVSESDETGYFDEDRRSSREQSPDLGDERERERVREIVSRISETTGSRISNPNRAESPRSEWLGETERERVRLVREWVQMASEQRDGRSSRREEERDRRSRDGSVTDHEEGQPEHVRRDLLRIRGRQARLDLIMRMVRERERELQGLEEQRSVSEFPHRNRIQMIDAISRISRGMSAKVAADSLEITCPVGTQTLMNIISDKHHMLAVRCHFSGFSCPSIYPNGELAIAMALLRGRFLRNGNATPTENERPPSVAARELGQLRQRHPVSGLREAFRFRLENIVRGQASSQAESVISHNINTARNDQAEAFTAVVPPNDNHESQLRNESGDNHQNAEVNTVPELEINRPNDGIDWQESVTQEENWREGVEHERREWQQSTEAGFSDWHDETGGGSDGNWQENIEQDWSGEIPEDEDGDDNHLPGVPEWHENDSHETLENWEEEPPEPPRVQHSIPTRRVNRFIPPDDDNVYSMELRELLSRRSVSNLLSSGFRESLDQLIQSYVQRQVHAPLDWDLQGSLPIPASPEEDLIQQGESNQDQQAVRPPLVMPSPPAPPRQPLWHSELHHSNWTRQSMNRPEIEWDIITDLRADMARLQQGMSHMQRMLEACMDMQLELQRSVRQEVSAALNRSPEGQGVVEDLLDDGSKWSQVRKGTCCVCCDTQIDALLYRCGHMCTCSKCANELVRGGGKCPLCRAPIIEVIRAYSIL